MHDDVFWIWVIVRNLLIAIGIGAAFLASAVVTFYGTAGIGALTEWLGQGPDDPLTVISARALSIVVVFVLDALIIGMLFRLLSGLKPSARVAVERRAARRGRRSRCCSSCRSCSSARRHRNPLYTSFASLIALLIWLNLSAQVILIAGAYIITGVAEEHGPRARALRRARRSRSGACTPPKTSRGRGEPRPRQRARRGGEGADGCLRRSPTYRAAQVRAAEAPLLAAGEPLMRRAAAALAAIVREELADAVAPRILVLAGSGDNGGDALLAAASLGGAGAEVDLLLVSDRFHEQALAAAVAAGARAGRPAGGAGRGIRLRRPHRRDPRDRIVGVVGAARGPRARSSRRCCPRCGAGGRAWSRWICRADCIPTPARPTTSCCRRRSR